MKLVVYYFSVGASTTISTQIMYVDKILLTIILYAVSDIKQVGTCSFASLI